MKKIFFILSLVYSLWTLTESATARTITFEEAFQIVKTEFTDQDVDFFRLKESDVTPLIVEQPLWTFFVDAEPMKGWEHDCYIVKIPKNIPTMFMSPSYVRKELRRLPPEQDFVPLLVKNRYGSNAGIKPTVSASPKPNGENPVANRTYAIILSGGIKPESNKERYWNDCSFIYQTLRNKYDVPRENIYPIMSDGDDPGLDMITTRGQYLSQPLDLDGDGTDDITLAATETNIVNTLNYLSSKLRKDDHLLFYVIDHGGTDDYISNSFICLWNHERLYDYKLAELLTPFNRNLVNVNVLLGQCYSGGFVDDLTKVGCVVSAACKGDEESYSCGDIPFDEFVYHWTCAVNEAKHDGTKVVSDSDNNGRITMQEAFEYAKLHDRWISEHPQYLSTPLSVGEDLAFDNLAPSLDLYIKDNPEDTGKEPNLTTDKHWLSPSIWVRNQDDGIYEHENPEYSSDHQMAFVYVRIHNRGKERFGGENVWVHVYWTQASTGLTPKVWKGREVYENKYPTGGHLEATPVPEIEPGDYADVCIGWALPQLLKNYPEGNFHFCLLCKLMETSFDDGYVDGKTYFDILGNNDHAQKNVTIIRKNNVNKSFNVYVRNIHSTAKSYTLELIPRTETDATLYSRAKVEMEMSPKIFSAWKRGGFECEDVEIPSPDTNASTSTSVKFVSPQSKLKKIELNGNEFDIVKLKFNFTKYYPNSSTYTFDLIQKNEEGEIIGGETFIIESPALVSKRIEIVPSPIEDGTIQLTADTTGFESISWKDNVGETISNENKVIVAPSYNSNKYEVIGMTKEGDVSTDCISLNSVTGIESVDITPNEIQINLRSIATTNSSIVISSSLNNNEFGASHEIPVGDKSISIDSSNFSKGIYVINYYIDAKIIDSTKIVLN